MLQYIIFHKNKPYKINEGEIGKKSHTAKTTIFLFSFLYFIIITLYHKIISAIFTTIKISLIDKKILFSYITLDKLTNWFLSHTKLYTSCAFMTPSPLPLNFCLFTSNQNLYIYSDLLILWFYTSVPTIMITWCCSYDWDRLFLPLVGWEGLKIKIFKEVKNPGEIMTLQQCTKNYDYMMYGCGDELT